jgi:hypothetical protein
MSMNDNISSSLDSFFQMRVLSNDNVSIYSNIGDIVVITVNFNTRVVVSFWINIDFDL